MSEPIVEKTLWTRADLELLPEREGIRYELIDGELFISHQPHIYYQTVCGRIFAVLDSWAQANQAGLASLSPGVLFSDIDDVAPDVMWISKARLDSLLDKAGHLTGAPELVVEVLSPGSDNERRDRETKLKLYQTTGAHEYWIVNWRLKQVEVYRRERGRLNQIATLIGEDELTTPLLPGFTCKVSQCFV